MPNWCANRLMFNGIQNSDSLKSVMSRWVPGAGYAVCVDFLDERQVRRWSDERKAAARRRNLERRVNRIAPLFADELIERELETRPDYFRGKSVR
ncbi:hypothetical protein DAX92_28835 [Salmonella enterica subsp. enterica]|uniref:Theronine dehydrogenase n=1 Tax=Salmonella enterica I TaxID=59201 RepID=A0A7Z1T9Y2_SALET|nr:hypothetical protein DAX92_28835 [Salmonella enterica subsp. enterica]PUF46555.1 hypothetical protein DAX73_28945 [Salmonella enterica subsp. enterica]